MEKSHQLAIGRYTVGRSGDCDIVLNHSSISKKHAVIEIANREVTVEDTGSVNGVYDRNEKITKRTYSGKFELGIGPYILKGALGGKEATELPRSGEKASVGFLRVLARFDLRLVLFIFFGVIVAAAYWGIQKPVRQQLNSTQQEEEAKRRILLARYLSEINRYAVENNQTDALRVDPVNLEAEVAYAYLVNIDGQVLAPLEDRGDFLDWPDFSAAVKKEAVTIGVGKKGERIVFYPLKVFNQLKVAAVVGFVSGTADSSKSGVSSTGTIALLFVLMALGGGLAAVALKIFLKPLQDLEEEVRVALKNNQTDLNFKAPYREIEELAQAFSRLLDRPPVPAAPSAPRKEKLASLSPGTGKKTGDTFQELAGLDIPWCILGTVESQVTRFNDGFRALCDNPKLTEGMHILEVFQQPNMLRAVSTLMDAQDQACAEIEDTDPPMQIRKRSVSEDTGQIILIFEEQSNV